MANIVNIRHRLPMDMHGLASGTRTLNGSELQSRLTRGVFPLAALVHFFLARSECRGRSPTRLEHTRTALRQGGCAKWRAYGRTSALTARFARCVVVSAERFARRGCETSLSLLESPRSQTTKHWCASCISLAQEGRYRALEAAF